MSTAASSIVRRCLPLAAILPLLAGDLSAQSAGPPPAGSRIRLTPAGGTPVVAQLVKWRADSIVVSGPAGEQTFGIGALSRIESHAGRRSRAGRGALIGLFAGAVTGAAIGLASGDDESGFFAFTAGEKAMMGAVGLGGLGTGLGAIIGSVTHVDRWRPVQLARPQVSALPGDRIGVTIGLQF